MSNHKIDYNKILQEAHINYSKQIIHKSLGFKNRKDYVEQRHLNNLLNFDLYNQNRVFEFMQDDDIYLAHVTTRKEEIVNDGKILCSSGCLVGSVYCVPAYKNGNGQYFLHNLGKYIFQKEVSFFSENNEKPEILLFKIEKPQNFSYSGLNYLKLGKFHLNVYKELKFLLNHDERSEVNESILKMIDWSRELMHILYKYKTLEIYKNFNRFYDILQKTISGVPIFGYFLFEITSEFIAYTQNDEVSNFYSQKKEIYVGNFKDIVFGVVPHLTKNFDLGQFIPDLAKVENRFTELNLDFEKYKLFIAESMVYYIKNYLFNGKIDPNFFSENITVNECVKICPHFVGHILHRIIRKMNRYPNFHINFDTFKAIKLWNFWNKNNIFFPFNSIMPKGEMGINPTIPNLKYSVYETKIIENNDKVLTFEKSKASLNVKIYPQLVELSKLIMRKKNEIKTGNKMIEEINQKIRLITENNPELFLNINNSVLQLNKDLDSIVSFSQNKNASLDKIKKFVPLNKLQIGGGPRHLQDYINMDIFEPADIVWDVRSGIPFPENKFDEIFCEHFFEHLDYPKSALLFLNEVFRVLKKEGIFKIVVPDCGKFLNEYMNKNKRYLKKITDLCYSKRIDSLEINAPIDIINYLFRDQFDNPKYTVHWWGYDKTNLKKLLQKTGFSLVKNWKFDKRLCNPKREFYSLYLMAKK